VTGAGAAALLAVDEVRVEFGGIVALADLSFTVDERQICALIGPNGAGKTTLFNCVSRLYEPTSGSIRFGGTDLLGEPAHRIATHGITRTFQNLALFPALTVLENVMLGAHAKREREHVRRAQAMAVLDRLGLADLAPHHAAGLPYGTLKRIELARALASRPRMLMLDEPAAGLTHSEVDELAELIRTLHEEYEMSVLLVEHHMQMVMAISEKIVVLDFGSKIAEGTPTEISGNARVIEAYLGHPDAREGAS
jgi:branched-chain amino acid transport system ATP-binding protein